MRCTAATVLAKADDIRGGRINVKADTSGRLIATARRHSALILGLSIALGIAVRFFVQRPSFYDLKVYRAEGRAVIDGLDLYGNLPGNDAHATYPPFAAMVFTPFAVIPLDVAKVLMTVLNLVLVVGCSALAVRLARPGSRWLSADALLLAALSLWLEPMFTTFRYGQINLIVLVLILGDLCLPAGSRWKGAGVGLATALKVTPAIFIVYFAVTRRVGVAVRAALTFGVTILLSLAVTGRETLDFWTHRLFETERVGKLENAVNQSVRGVLVRIQHTRDIPSGEYVVLAALVALVGMTIAVYAYRRLGDGWGGFCCAVTGLLVSPISWSHHWVWCIPMIALLAVHVRWLAAVAVLVYGSFVVWALAPENSRELHLTPLQIALSGWYVYFGVAFLTVAAHRCRSASNTDRALPQRSST